MASALRRRAWRELSRRRARAAFTIASVAAAVVALWMFAIPMLVNAEMANRVEDHRLDDVRLNPGAITLSDAEVEALAAIPNVAGIDVRSFYATTLHIGNQRRDVFVVGVRDFSAQQVNVVEAQVGALPASDEVLVDSQNRRTGRLDAGTGDVIGLVDAIGRVVEFPVSGEGGTLRYSDPVRDGSPVVYLHHESLTALSRSDAFHRVEMRVQNRAELGSTLDAVRTSLLAMVPDLQFQTIATVRPEGDWPGRESMENVVQLFYVLAALAAASGLFMVSNTMNSIVREQTGEIAMMKAIGGQRRQIAGTFVQSALLVGSIGTALGVAAGIVLSNLLLQLIASSLMTLTPGWGISWPLLVISALVGVCGAVVASLPAVWRAVRVSVHEALGDPGISAGYGAGTVDQALQRLTFLPRIEYMGLRNTARRKGASLAAAFQVAIALGIALGLLMLGVTIMDAAETWRNNEGADIDVGDGFGAPGFQQALERVDGVAAVEGVYFSTVGIDDEGASLLGLAVDTQLFGKDVVAGRWFDESEDMADAGVAVMGRPLAELTGTRVGDVVPVETMRGRSSVEIIGIDGNMVNDGKVLYLPIEAQYALDLRSVPNWYWVETEQQDEAFVDQVALGIERSLRAARVPSYSIELNYIDAAAARSEERLIVGIIGILGIPIVAIGMIGLASSLAMSVIERTREIGILRAIGAGSGDIRRMVRAEALALSLLGWLLALPFGYLIGSAMLWLIGRAFHNSFGTTVPYWAALPALVAALVLAPLIVRRPARRAARLSPGTAIRYE